MIARSSKVIIEPLKGVADERKAHLGTLVLLSRGGNGGAADGLGLEQGGVVGLVDLVGGEVGGVDVGGQTGLEGGADPAQALELDTPEEGVVLDFVSATSSETVFRVAYETGNTQGALAKV